MSFLNKKVFEFSEDSFGLDVSDSFLRVVQMEKNGDVDSIRSFGCVALPTGVISNGEIIKDSIVIQKIKEVFSKAGPKRITTKNVICSLPETKAFLRLISIPKMEEEEIKEAIKWEIEDNIPLSLDKVYYDWQLLDDDFGGKKGKMDVLVLAMARETVDKFLSATKEAGLEVVGLEVESTAQVASLLSQKNNEETTLIIDFGESKTELVISLKNIPVFTSSIPLSTRYLKDSFIKKLDLKANEVDKSIANYGIGSFSKRDPVFLAAKPILENLAAEIEKSIDFYITGLKYSESVDRIILSGMGANIKGMVPYLSKRIGKEIKEGDPWINIDFGESLPIIGRDEANKYAAAIGAAVKGTNKEM